MNVRVCALEEVPVGEARRFDADGRTVAVVNLGEAGVHAIDAVCSHEHSWLDEGDVDLDEGTIECPKHGSTFDVAHLFVANIGRCPPREETDRTVFRQDPLPFQHDGAGRIRDSGDCDGVVLEHDGLRLGHRHEVARRHLALHPLAKCQATVAVSS